jgi:hypothetical protein
MHATDSGIPILTVQIRRILTGLPAFSLSTRGFVRAIHFVNLRCHGLGVLDEAVRLKCRHIEEHGLAEDGKTVAPNFSDFNK